MSMSEIIALIDKIDKEKIILDKLYFGDSKPNATLALLWRYYNIKPSAKGRGGNRILKKLQKYINSEHNLQAYFYDHHIVDGDTLICEPYGITKGDIKNLENFCNIHTLEYHITGESYHYPNNTVRIVISEAKKNE